MFLWCRKYMADRTEDEVKSAVEHWTNKNKKWLGKKLRDPTSIAKAHMVSTDMSADQMSNDLDWDIFAPDGLHDF